MEPNKSRLNIVYILAILGDLVSGMIFVVTVMYGTQIGLSTIEIGLIGSAYGLAYAIMPMILGKIGDKKITRKNSLLIATLGQIILAVFLTLVVLQKKNFIFFGFFLVLILYGVIYGFFWPSIEAYISENTDHSSKAHAQGIANFCIAWSIGYSFGPLFAGLFIDYDIVFAFVFAFISYVVCFLLVFFGLPSIKRTKKTNNIDKLDKIIHEQKDFNPEKVSQNRISNSNKVFILLIMGVMVYSSISKVIISYFPNYAVSSAGLQWTGTLTGQVMLFFGLGRTFYFIISRFLKNSFIAITQSFLIIVICLIAVFFITNAPLFMINFFIFGFFIGRTYLVSLELLLKDEQENKGAKAGIFESIVGFGSASAPLIAGLIASVNLKLPFIIFSIVAFIFAIIHFTLQKNIVLENVLEKKIL